LGGCKNLTEVKSKISVFKQLLADNPPQVWKDFFAEIQKKPYQINNRNEMKNSKSLPYLTIKSCSESLQVMIF
jgi:hypothetical protein